MTVYESANAANPRDRLERMVRRNGDLLGNSTALMATSMITSLLGFVYWWVAARSFPAEAVGVASAAVSAMTLVGTLGMFGMGTLLISELPRSKSGQWRLISTCVSVAATTSTVGGIIYLFLALFVIPGLRESLDSPLGMCLLVVATGLNGATLVLDEGLIGLLAGHLQLLRNAYFAVGKLVFIGVLAVLPIAATGTDLLATWMAGMLLSVLLIAVPLRSRAAGNPIRPRLSVLHGLAGRAMDHNLLNVALFLPRICLPLVVTSVVSTQATAAFYTAWMVMSFLAMIPGSITTTLFAVASGDLAGLRQKVRLGLAIALSLGVPLSLGIALFARPLMGVFGKSYVSTAGAALAILALTHPAGAIRQFYVAISRVRQRTRQASIFAVGVGLAELAVAWEGGRRGGLIGLVTWLAVTIVLEGAVLAPSVLRVVLSRVPSQRPAADGAAEGDWSPPKAPSTVHANRGGREAVTRVRAKRLRRGPARRAKGPQHRVGSPRMDETAIIPLRRSDATVVFRRPKVEDTVRPSARDAETLMFDRPRLDETVQMPKVVDQPGEAAGRSANGAATSAPARESTVDNHAETAIIPKISASMLPEDRSKNDGWAADGALRTHGGDR
jgi:O-antigen/teichoic acid export membrane protein